MLGQGLQQVLEHRRMRRITTLPPPQWRISVTR
jgi:hypothetical protein